MNNIGFMQGRLSPLVDNQIQAFPFNHWDQEFALAKEIGLFCMEWTLDYPYLYQNPLLNTNDQKKIKNISKNHNIKIPSVTLDSCMQRPFWKVSDKNIFNKLIEDLKLIINSSREIGAQILVIPLVDNGSIENDLQFKKLKTTLISLSPYLIKNSIRIAFESDYGPHKLKNFIDNFEKSLFGINYDTGNSASLGFNPDEEFNEYGDRIINIHLKDRKINGPTVRLGFGDADFKKIFQNMQYINFNGNLILQTARAQNNNHFEELKLNFEFTKQFL